MDRGMVSTGSRRLLAMIWFAGFALLAVGVFFYPLSMTLRARFLFMGLPAIAGGMAGCALGGNILDHTKTRGYGQAIFRGAGAALAAFAIFAGLFALSLPFAEQLWTRGSTGGLFLGTLIFGLVMAGPLAVAAGGMAGASLYWFDRRRFTERGSGSPKDTGG